MPYFERLVVHAIQMGAPFYVEHNDFLSGNLTLEEEIQDLLEDNDVDEDVANDMRLTRSIWSIRYYHHDGRFNIVYHFSLEEAAEQMLELLGMTV